MIRTKDTNSFSPEPTLHTIGKQPNQGHRVSFRGSWGWHGAAFRGGARPNTTSIHKFDATPANVRDANLSTVLLTSSRDRGSMRVSAALTRVPCKVRSPRVRNMTCTNKPFLNAHAQSLAAFALPTPLTPTSDPTTGHHPCPQNANRVILLHHRQRAQTTRSSVRPRTPHLLLRRLLHMIVILMWFQGARVCVWL